MARGIALPQRLVRWEEDEADGRWYAFGLGHLREGAGRGVDAKHHDGIGMLIFGEQEVARGVDGEVAWFLAAGGEIARLTQGSLLWIHRKDSDGVVAPVGRKEPSSTGVKGNFCRVVPAGKSLRQRGNPLKLAIRSPRIVGKDRHGRLQFTENIHEIPVGRERHMAWTCAWAEGRREGVIRLCRAGLCIQGRRVTSDERALGGVEIVDEDTVETQVRDVRETIACRDPDPVSVRAFLALLVGAHGTCVRQERGMLAESSVREDGEYSDVARRVVGDKDVLAGFVEGYVARIFAERGKLIQQGELPALRIKSESADGALFARLVNGVYEFTVGMDGDEGGVGRFHGKSLRGQFARLRVELVSVDAFAIGFIGVGADEREVAVARGGSASSTGKSQDSQRRSERKECKQAACDFHKA